MRAHVGLGRRPPCELEVRSADTSNLFKTALTKLEEEDVTAATEPVLLSFKDTTPLEVNVFTLNTEVHVSINHVLKLVRAGSLTRLVYLVDDKSDSVGFLTELKDFFKDQRAVSYTHLTLPTILRV